MKGNILITLPEDKEKSKQNYFAIKKNSVGKDIGGGDHVNFSKAFKEKGYNIFYVNWDDLNGKEFDRMFDYNSNLFIDPKSIDEMNLIFVYKQENFLNEKERFYKMLDRFEESGAIVINDPKTIKMNLSKEYLIDFEKKGFNIPKIYPFNEEIVKKIGEEISQGKSFILKPKMGERGIGIEKINSLKELELFNDKSNDYFIQEFLPSIREGERSLGFVGLEYSHAVIKVPNPKNKDEYKCNNYLGGVVKPYNPTEKEIEFSKKILKEFESRGYPVHFSRIDVVNVNGESFLMEAELLNPSIFANYSGEGDSFGKKFADYVDELIKGRLKK